MDSIKTDLNFNFGGEGRICGSCGKEAKFTHVDDFNNVEVYECPCGDFHYTKPVIENKK